MAHDEESRDEERFRAADSIATAVVGIAASSASLRSFQTLFAGLASPLDAAIVVVFKRHDGLQEAALEALRAQSAMPVEIAQSRTPLLSGRIYLAPQDMLITVKDGQLLCDVSTTLGERGTIDSFLISLAEDRQEKAIAVVLAGMEGDGTLGALTTKEFGGLAIAELESMDGAVRSNPAGATAIADHVLPPEQMADRLAQHLMHRAQVDEAISSGRADTRDVIARVATILRNKTGHDFHGYKQNTFMRRIQRRMQVRQIGSLERYVETLRASPEEVNDLFQDLLISVTQFFRDRKEFEFLEQQVIPKLLEGKKTGDQVRIWVLGCATGEEAYSIAILLQEAVSRLDVAPQIQIFATDIDGKALAVARAGRYPEAIAKDLSPERLARWFVREGHTYCVVKELREMCIFSSHNLIKDAPFSRIDLISCRNLLIYLNGDLQTRIIPLFHFALRPGGYLFLGPSENVTRHHKLFQQVDRKFRIFQRQESINRVLPAFPLSTAGQDRRRQGDPPPTPSSRPEHDITKRAERAAERYAPAYVVIDEQYEVIQFSGRTGRFLDPTSGSASLNLLNLIHRDLRLDLRAALHRVVALRETVKLERLTVGQNGDQIAINLVIEPLPGNATDPLVIMVLFQEVDSPGKIASNDAPVDSGFLRDEHVQRLEAELRSTRERLQATIEELESTNEELKSSNEEYQSINEEVQSANEELETSKEELQSVNEELNTVNGELAQSVSDLARANSDLKNLLENTQIATVFLDNELHIKNFTPAVTEIFHLIETDLGRPITHITSRIAYNELQDDIRKVQRTLSTIERNVEDPRSGSCYLVRVLPYRSVDNFIAGVVLTFLNVTAVVKAEDALRESEERFRMMAQTMPLVLFTSSTGLDWDYVNPRFSEYTDMPTGSALGEGWMAALHPDDIKGVRQHWAISMASGEPFEHEFRLRSAHSGYRWYLARAQAMHDANGDIVRWFGSLIDIHERRSSEGRQKLLFSELQHRVKNILAVVRSIAGHTLSTSPTMEEFAAHFEGRIDALARAQTFFARRARDGIDLEQIVAEELRSHAFPNGEQVRIEGPQISLTDKVAETLGLAIHELTTNAIKYGALSNGSGRVEVRWQAYTASNSKRLTFEWKERTVPVIDTKPHRIGFGRELIERGLPYELGANTALEFRPGGIRCVIDLPISNGRERSPLFSEES